VRRLHPDLDALDLHEGVEDPAKGVTRPGDGFHGVGDAVLRRFVQPSPHPAD
jgi:hypothetical protein